MNWLDPSRYLTHIYLEQSCAEDPYAQQIIKRAGLPFSILSESELANTVAGEYPDNLGTGKKILYLCRNHGEFLKQCPATREYRCCDYQVVNIGAGCPMDCVYYAPQSVPVRCTACRR